jgi:hypothetical protein
MGADEVHGPGTAQSFDLPVGSKVDTFPHVLTEVDRRIFDVTLGTLPETAGSVTRDLVTQDAKQATLLENRRLTNRADGVRDLDVPVVNRDRQRIQRIDNDTKGQRIGFLRTEIRVAAGNVVVLTSRAGRDVAVLTRQYLQVRTLGFRVCRCRS